MSNIHVKKRAWLTANYHQNYHVQRLVTRNHWSDVMLVYTRFILESC